MTIMNTDTLGIILQFLHEYERIKFCTLTKTLTKFTNTEHVTSGKKFFSGIKKSSVIEYPHIYFCKAVSSENFIAAQYIYDLVQIDVNVNYYDAFLTACRNGDEKSAQWLVSVGNITSSICTRAFDILVSDHDTDPKILPWLKYHTIYNHQKLIEWYDIENFSSDKGMKHHFTLLRAWYSINYYDNTRVSEYYVTRIFYEACKCGHLEFAQFIRDKLKSDIGNNDIGTSITILQNFLGLYTTTALDFSNALDRKRLNVLKWLCTFSDNDTYSNTCYMCVRPYRLNILKELYFASKDRFTGISENLFNIALEKQYIEIVEWIYKNVKKCNIEFSNITLSQCNYDFLNFAINTANIDMSLLKIKVYDVEHDICAAIIFEKLGVRLSFNKFKKEYFEKISEYENDEDSMIENAVWISQKVRIKLSSWDRAFKNAFRAEKYKFAKWICDNYEVCYTTAFVNACLKGNHYVAEWLKNHDIKMTQFAINNICNYSVKYPSIVQIIINKFILDRELIQDIFVNACTHGFYETAVICENYFNDSMFTHDILLNIVKGGNVKILARYHDKFKNKIINVNELGNIACMKGHSDVVMWFADNYSYTPDSFMIIELARTKLYSISFDELIDVEKILKKWPITANLSGGLDITWSGSWIKIINHSIQISQIVLRYVKSDCVFRHLREQVIMGLGLAWINIYYCHFMPETEQ